MTPGQVDTAFGNKDGQTGLSIMRMRIDPNANNRDIQVLSAQRAKSHGAILLASPWKSRRRYHITWNVSISIEGTVNSLWNGNWSWTGSTLNVSDAAWNSTLQPGQTGSSLGFCASR